jgi:hypothetical protein
MYTIAFGAKFQACSTVPACPQAANAMRTADSGTPIFHRRNPMAGPPLGQSQMCQNWHFFAAQQWKYLANIDLNI